MQQVAFGILRSNATVELIAQQPRVAALRSCAGGKRTRPELPVCQTITPRSDERG